VIARIFIHGRGIVLAPTTAVPSHISPLTAAILSLMRLMRVCVHAVLYVDWTNAEPDLSVDWRNVWSDVPDAEPDLSTTVLAN
jgi:hypothetical protein